MTSRPRLASLPRVPDDVTADLVLEWLDDPDQPDVRRLIVDLTFEDQARYDHPRQSRVQIAAGMPPIGRSFVGENHLLVAREAPGGTPLGVCWCVLFDPGTGLEAEVAELYVQPPARGRGIASALLRGAMELFRSRGVTFACVWTRDDNPAALAAYHGAGFTPTEQAVLTWLPLENG